jgi:hypothetical protein
MALLDDFYKGSWTSIILPHVALCFMLWIVFKALSGHWDEEVKLLLS